MMSVTRTGRSISHFTVSLRHAMLTNQDRVPKYSVSRPPTAVFERDGHDGQLPLAHVMLVRALDLK